MYGTYTMRRGPVGNSDHLIKKVRPSEGISSQPIEPLRGDQRQEKVPLPPTEEGEGASFPFSPASFTLYVKKFFRSLPLGRRVEFNSETHSDLFHKLELLQKSLVRIADEDVSYKPEFTNKLSLLWESLNTELEKIKYSTDRKNEVLVKIQLLIEDLADYPPGKDHPLGYYLSEAIGVDWLPVPFLQILRGLHSSYQEDPDESTLGKWLAELAEILEPTEE